jgi:hypothetical protein
MTTQPALAVSAIGAVEPVEVHVINGAQHRPDQMILGQPVSQRRRQQQHLLTIARDEVLAHLGMVLN